jgi:copper chaperone CopZ
MATLPTPVTNQIPRTHRTEGTRPVLTYVTADINCPTCFNQVIDTITATPGVHTVDPHVADGCIAITHDLEETVLLATITTIGHTLDIAPNGEFTMGQAHATTGHACDAHQPPH